MFEWKAEYALQISSVDNQHQNLFRTAGELHAAISNGTGQAVLDKVLDRLIQYTTVHFAHEERLMAETGYPDLAAHQAEHAALTKQVLQFQEDFKAGRTSMTIQLMKFLQRWLEQHILKSDRLYAPHVKELAAS